MYALYHLQKLKIHAFNFNMFLFEDQKTTGLYLYRIFAMFALNNLLK